MIERPTRTISPEKIIIKFTLGVGFIKTSRLQSIFALSHSPTSKLICSRIRGEKVRAESLCID
jgi:hypothetical protein